MMEMMRRVSTNVDSAGGTRAPMYQIAFLRPYPTAKLADVVAPTPSIGKRYVLFPTQDAWTNV